MIEVIMITITRQGKRREYTLRVGDPKLTPHTRDDRYAEGFVADISLGETFVARTSAWTAPEDAVGEAVSYLLGEWADQ
jgi:hypothetical protein